MFGEHEKCLFQNENNVVLNEKSGEGDFFGFVFGTSLHQSDRIHDGL